MRIRSIETPPLAVSRNHHRDQHKANDKNLRFYVEGLIVARQVL